VIEGLIQATCPKCRSANRYWHKAGVFLAIETAAPGGSGGFAPAAVVACPDCGFIEFYAQSATLLQHLPEAEVPTQRETPTQD
jgi:predicted nucleic-acid-binding Zn-ribbon protein